MSLSLVRPLAVEAPHRARDPVVGDRVSRRAPVVGSAAPRPEPQPARAPTPADTSGMGRFLDSLLARMTLEEKLGQLNQPGGRRVNDTGPAARAGGEAEIRAGRIGSFLGVNGADDDPQAAADRGRESRAGDPAPLRQRRHPRLPHHLPGPARRGGELGPGRGRARRPRRRGRGDRARGAPGPIAPMVDIARDPRWGRIVEGSRRGSLPRRGHGARRAYAGSRARTWPPTHAARDREALRGVRGGGGRPRLQHRRHLPTDPLRDLPAAVRGGGARRRRQSVMAGLQRDRRRAHARATASSSTDVLRERLGLRGRRS